MIKTWLKLIIFALVSSVTMVGCAKEVVPDDIEVGTMYYIQGFELKKLRIGSTSVTSVGKLKLNAPRNIELYYDPYTELSADNGYLYASGFGSLDEVMIEDFTVSKSLDLNNSTCGILFTFKGSFGKFKDSLYVMQSNLDENGNQGISISSASNADKPCEVYSDDYYINGVSVNRNGELIVLAVSIGEDDDGFEGQLTVHVFDDNFELVQKQKFETLIPTGIFVAWEAGGNIYFVTESVVFNELEEPSWSVQIHIIDKDMNYRVGDLGIFNSNQSFAQSIVYQTTDGFELLMGDKILSFENGAIVPNVITDCELVDKDIVNSYNYRDIAFFVLRDGFAIYDKHNNITEYIKYDHKFEIITPALFIPATSK